MSDTAPPTEPTSSGDPSAAGSSGYRWRQRSGKDGDRPKGGRDWRELISVAVVFAAVLGVVVGFVYYLIVDDPQAECASIALTEYPETKNGWPLVTPYGENDSMLLTDSARKLFPASNYQRDVSKSFDFQEYEKLMGRLGSLGKEHSNWPLVIHLTGAGLYLKDKLYILPINLEADNPEKWLDVEQILDKIAEAPSKRKLLIVDIAHPNVDPFRGMLMNDVSLRLHELLKAREKAGKLPFYVLTSCGPGEISWPCEAEETTIFAHYLAEGLAGAADGYLSEGGINQQVKLNELYAYVRDHTDRWVKRCYGDALGQAPQLYGLHDPDDDGYILNYITKDVPAPKFEPGGGPPGYPDWLAAGWAMRDEWKKDGIARIAPKLFRRLELETLRAEERWLYKPNTRDDLRGKFLQRLEECKRARDNLGKGRAAKEILTSLAEIDARPKVPPAPPSKDAPPPPRIGRISRLSDDIRSQERSRGFLPVLLIDGKPNDLASFFEKYDLIGSTIAANPEAMLRLWNEIIKATDRPWYEWVYLGRLARSIVEAVPEEEPTELLLLWELGEFLQRNYNGYPEEDPTDTRKEEAAKAVNDLLNAEWVFQKCLVGITPDAFPWIEKRMSAMLELRLAILDVFAMCDNKRPGKLNRPSTIELSEARKKIRDFRTQVESIAQDADRVRSALDVLNEASAVLPGLFDQLTHPRLYLGSENVKAPEMAGNWLRVQKAVQELEARMAVPSGGNLDDLERSARLLRTGLNDLMRDCIANELQFGLKDTSEKATERILRLRSVLAGPNLTLGERLAAWNKFAADFRLRHKETKEIDGRAFADRWRNDEARPITADPTGENRFKDRLAQEIRRALVRLTLSEGLAKATTPPGTPLPPFPRERPNDLPKDPLDKQRSSMDQLTAWADALRTAWLKLPASQRLRYDRYLTEIDKALAGEGKPGDAWYQWLTEYHRRSQARAEKLTAELPVNDKGLFVLKKVVTFHKDRTNK